VIEEGPSWCYVAELSLPFTLPFVAFVSQVRVPRADTDSSLTVKHACFVCFFNADVVYIVVISFSTWKPRSDSWLVDIYTSGKPFLSSNMLPRAVRTIVLSGVRYIVESTPYMEITSVVRLFVTQYQGLNNLSDFRKNLYGSCRTCVC